MLVLCFWISFQHIGQNQEKETQVYFIIRVVVYRCQPRNETVEDCWIPARIVLFIYINALVLILMTVLLRKLAECQTVASRNKVCEPSLTTSMQILCQADGGDGCHTTFSLTY